MTKHFFKPSLAGMAMLAAMCGYAAAQTATNTSPATQQSSQNTAAMQSTQNLQMVSANAQLVKSVNSKDASQGQTVKAKLTSSVRAANGVKLDKGTMLIGKVEQVRKSNNDGPAKLSLGFDRAQLKDGKTVPVKATLLGAYPSANWVDPTATSSLMPLQPHTIPSDRKVDQQPGTLSHVAMHSSVQSNASGVFTNKDGNVNLKRGTRLQVAIAPSEG